jgi:hypothetical protein
MLGCRLGHLETGRYILRRNSLLLLMGRLVSRVYTGRGRLLDTYHLLSNMKRSSASS